ncbi:hypothetical protein E2C01_061220 [Portunus trituberculatus]|uniref:Uncharacterized protein n=1 Tax=Portunus trituberculatus TaxID=210409 RepID=A0A5B7HAQ8_PORTR|nr:hypothetical protein [Portunus trituberculatus]
MEDRVAWKDSVCTRLRLGCKYYRQIGVVVRNADRQCRLCGQDDSNSLPHYVLRFPELSQITPPARKPLPRVRKPNLQPDRGQDSNPCTWRPSDPNASMVLLYHGGLKTFVPVFWLIPFQSFRELAVKVDFFFYHFVVLGKFPSCIKKTL